MDSWALKAIETEAMKRAQFELLSGGQTIAVLGLSVKQILWLKTDYERRTGKPASELPA
jgi:hypothetical protein